MGSIRVLLADDHTLIRAGIRSLLEKIRKLEVVAEASNGREAVQLAHKFQPDIVLMDIAMPELNGLEAATKLKKELPDISIIILSMYVTEEYVLKAFRCGASGYLVKDAATNELEIAISSVANGETYLSPPVSKHVINKYLSPSGAPNFQEINLPENAEPSHKLTYRQREVLQLIAEGSRTKEIAEKLNVSVKTIETHRRQLMERLDIYDVPGLVRYAIRIGLISSDN